MKKTGRQDKRRAGRDKDQGDSRQRARWLLNDGARLLSERQPIKASRHLERARQLDPDNVEIALNLGGAYVMQGRHADAVPILEEASRVAPDNVMVWINLAAAHLGFLEVSDEEKQQKAIAAFERALDLDPKASTINYNLGLIYQQRGETEKAASHFWRVLELNPSDNDARIRLRQLGIDDTQSRQM